MLSCIEIVMYTKVAATMQSVVNNSPKESLVEKAAVMIKITERMVCFSCVFFNSLYDTINLDSSGLSVTSITLYIISKG